MRAPTKPATRALATEHLRLAIAVSLFAHAVALWAYLQARPTLPLSDVRPMEVLLTVSPRAPRRDKTPVMAPRPRLKAAQASRPDGPGFADVKPRVAGGPAAVAPPDTAAPQPGLDGGVARSWRRRMGCQQADLLALTRQERDACLEMLAAGSQTATAYAVISQRKKDIFDGVHTCRKGDDWCLYRSGKGPYPGLFGLSRDFRSK